MTPTMRSFLLEHIHANKGRLPINRRAPGKRVATLLDAIRRGFIREGDKYERNHRPKHTYITDTGRYALSKALGAWADQLTAQEARIEQMREMAELTAIADELAAIPSAGEKDASSIAPARRPLPERA